MEMEQMASRPFATCNVDLPSTAEEALLRQESVTSANNIRGSQRYKKVSPIDSTGWIDLFCLLKTLLMADRSKVSTNTNGNIVCGRHSACLTFKIHTAYTRVIGLL